MLKFLKNSEKWLSPIKGKVIPMKEVPDEVFAGKMMGDGFAIIPEDSKVYSPMEGTIFKVFTTKHALLIITKSGLEVILHMGIGTVELKGQGFDIHVKDGDKIKAGELLATADFDYIKSAGKSIVTPIVITNMDKIKKMDIHYGDFNEKTEVCEISVK